MLQSDPKVKAAMAKPAAKPAAGKKAGGAMGAMVKDLSGQKPAAAPTATSSTGGTTTTTATGKVHKANPNNPNAAAPAGGASAAPAATPTAAPAAPAGEAPPTKNKKVAKKKPAAPSQAEIDADRERLMGVTSDSVIRKGKVMSESFSFYRKQ